MRIGTALLVALVGAARATAVFAETNAFATAIVGRGEGTTLPWTLDEPQASNRWTLALEAPPGTIVTLALQDSRGRTIAAAYTPDVRGALRLADLGLAAGSYSIAVGGTPAGTKLTLAAEASGPRGPSVEEEPNGDPATAFSLAPDTAVKGRLVVASGSADADVFVVDLDETWRDRRLELVLRAPRPSSLRLDIIDEAGSVLQTRAGAGEVRLRGLVLGPGRHLVRASGNLDPGVSYTLICADGGPPTPDAEREPNDLPALASVLPAEAVSGKFDGNEYDYVDLGTSGGLQVWDVEASGEGLARLSLHDGANQEIGGGSRATGADTIRLSRLLLPAGRNLVRLEGGAGSWSLRTSARGSPREGEEVEPNDDETRALVIVPGRPQTGWLDHAGDRDMYFFNLAAPTHVAIALAAPPELPTEMTLGWGAWTNRFFKITTAGALGAAQTARWDGVLEAGDYGILLATLGATADDPYELSLDLEPYFERPADLEPNDRPSLASAPAGMDHLRGRLNVGDVDWYRLPRISAGTFQVMAARLSGGALGLALVQLTGDGTQSVGNGALYAAGDTASFATVGGSDLALVVSGSGGVDYDLALTGLGLERAPETLSIEASIELEAESIRAFEPRAQRTGATLRVRNNGNTSLRLDTRSWIGNELWRVANVPAAIDVGAQREVSVPFSIEAAPDADEGPVAVEVALQRAGSEPAIARAGIEVSADAEPVAAAVSEPLPPTMLGGLNVAWNALGGQSTAAGLIDGVVDGAGVTMNGSTPPTFDLAGESAVPLAGVILYPPPGSVPADRIAEFAVEVTQDRMSFTRVLQARASAQAREQAFAFTTPVAARAVRLVPLSTHGGGRDSMVLAELKIVADPAFNLRDEGFDVASVRLGGHVVRAAGFGEIALTGEGAVWPGDSPVAVPAGESAAREWVIGFLNGRAARIARIAWQQRVDAPVEQRMREVAVAASVAGPFGPWTELGHWRVDTAQSLTPASPVWARALRFRLVDPSSGPATLPQSIAVLEQPGSGSVVAEWGDASRSGPYEASLPEVPGADDFPAVGHSLQTATVLPPGAVARGRVQRGVSEDWYTFDLPQGTRALRLNFADGVASEVAVTLFDAAGRATELLPDAERPGERVGPAAAGKWSLRVTQPPQSIVVSWDTSISVGPLVPHVTRLVRRLVWELRPEHEQLNLLPFGSERLLMRVWSGEPGVVYGALHAYPAEHTSSDADGALLTAVNELAGRVGSRAVVLVTDAADGITKAEELWGALERTRARVFALHLPVDSDPVRVPQQVNLLRDWSGATGGFYSRFASQGDAEAMFRRIRAWLRQSATYAFTLSPDTRPPRTGKLIVTRAEPGGGGSVEESPAVEIVLDASGSMLQRLDGVRRIEVARQALAGLAAGGLPPRTQLALRVFGQAAAGSCASEAVLPLAPFDALRFGAAVARIQPVDGAKTPIGESLRLAGADLANLRGPKLIVLVTDGEETCGGDAKSEIAKLREAGLDVRVNIVGFAVDDAALKQTFVSWATAGGGSFFDAGNARALDEALQQAVATPFEVTAADGAVIAVGTVGGDALELPAGTYTVRTVNGKESVAVTISPEETSTLRLGTGGD